ncbi:MAG: hypothetical protein KDA24_26900 [Deltaproteobacteria bacterium]|nr:hypothetical protein [Deltaproteobacteria bacterium]
METPSKRWSTKALAVVFGLCVALLGGEAGVRLWGGEGELFVPMVGRTVADLPVHMASPDPELLYQLRPDVDVSLTAEDAALWEEEARHADDPRRMITNRFGFRGGPWEVEKEVGTVRVLCLGGSNTYGAAVSQGRDWPAQLEAVLHERGATHVQVWNLGTDGYQTRQKIHLAEKAIEEWTPDLLVWQLANTGPRVVLQPMAASVDAWLDPSGLPPDGGIYAENLATFPKPGSAWMLLVLRSALIRTTLVAWNRIRRSRGGGGPPAVLVERAEARSGGLFANLVADGTAQHVLFVPPPSGRPPWFDGLDVPMVDLRDADKPDLPDVDLLHPGATVYRWYAEELGDALLDGGCLEPGAEACAPG